MSTAWNQAPEGATEIVTDGEPKALRWAKKSHVWSFVSDQWKFRHESWITIATREPEQPRKTVEDAVEYYNSEFPSRPAILGIGYSNNKIVPYYKGSPLADGTNSPDSYIICTREEFEEHVSAKEVKSEPDTATDEPEWTHTLDGRKCKIILDKPDVDEDIVVLCEYGDYQLVNHGLLKPIKPEITKAEAWDLFVSEGWSTTDIMGKHEVVE